MFENGNVLKDLKPQIHIFFLLEKLVYIIYWWLYDSSVAQLFGYMIRKKKML